MGGWGEPKNVGISARMTARAELDRRASFLADAVAEHRREQSTGNAERMYAQLDEFLEARRQALYG